MHLEKNRTYACRFPVQRKEINVVKFRFTMRYSSRKLSNDKVITTACNFWRQIACPLQVMSGNILFLGNKIFEIPPFLQTRPGDLGKKVHACSLRFSALKCKRKVQRCLSADRLSFSELFDDISLMLNVRRLCVVVDSLISAAKVCDCVISAWCWQVCDRMVELQFRQNILSQPLILFRRCLAQLIVPWKSNSRLKKIGSRSSLSGF